MEWSAGDTMVADKYSRFETTTLLPEDRALAIEKAKAILDARNKGRPCIVGIRRSRHRPVIPLSTHKHDFSKQQKQRGERRRRRARNPTIQQVR